MADFAVELEPEILDPGSDSTPSHSLSLNLMPTSPRRRWSPRSSPRQGQGQSQSQASNNNGNAGTGSEGGNKQYFMIQSGNGLVPSSIPMINFSISEDIDDTDTMDTVDIEDIEEDVFANDVYDSRVGF